MGLEITGFTRANLDTLWVDHLTELDDMRRGIGLRGYGGIDPLNEFKREAFKLYEEFRGFISKQVANTIFRVQVNPAAGPAPRPAGTPHFHGDHVHADVTTTSSNGDGSASITTAPQVAAAAAVPGLASAVARRGPIQFQHGDEPVATQPGPATAKAASTGSQN